ncbi:DNA cytosine methyltransferase [Xanthomonas axonopodis]|uniref:DNA cytosine methyltransferase n=1 Tax=Xanthomonas axonopodis TaxID=53413 RepID=UPI003555F3EC
MPLTQTIHPEHLKPPVFVDAFAGCGGLSLGLLNAGWEGLFAIEKDANAFATLKHNLIDPTGHCQKFGWPNWLPAAPIDISNLLVTHINQLSALNSRIDLLAGGPPCQGFSSAGRRQADDPRNELFRAYINLVEVLSPSIVLIENVRGIGLEFKSQKGKEPINYAKEIERALSAAYQTQWQLLKASDFGVPQNRERLILIATKKGLPSPESIFHEIRKHSEQFSFERKLIPPVSSYSALSDLEVSRNGTRPSSDSPGFDEIAYYRPLTTYQQLMNAGMSSHMTDTRLARHRSSISERFQSIIKQCNELGRLNKSLNKEMRESYAMKKRAFRVIDPHSPSPTVTSMPDDLLHYQEPRTLTVRENARLQSFPDWFEFKGKYTSGGARRKMEVPRFTQVANAVPPLMAEAIGLQLKQAIINSKVDINQDRNLAEVFPMLD